MRSENFITSENIYRIIMDYGPVSIMDIGKILAAGRFLSFKDYTLSERCAVGGMLSSMLQKGKIKCVERPCYYKMFVVA